MRRPITQASLILVFVLAVHVAANEDKPKSSPKEALQGLNDFIGQWNGSGQGLKAKGDLWTETINWSWRFKGDDAWLELSIKNGKYFKGGELRYLADKKLFELTAIDKDGRKQPFAGELKNGLLRLERVDPDKRETQRITMNTAAEGIRFIFLFERKPENRTIYAKDFQVACNREGESLAAGKKKVECVVSGGLGTIAVSYNGVTYYVCCTGCRDAFNENPKKYVDEFKAKKK